MTLSDYVVKKPNLIFKLRFGFITTQGNPAAIGLKVTTHKARSFAPFPFGKVCH